MPSKPLFLQKGRNPKRFSIFYAFRTKKTKIDNSPFSCSVHCSQKQFYFKMMMISRPSRYFNLVRIMQRALLRSKPIRPYNVGFGFAEQRTTTVVPRDVKEGYFTVFAVKCEKPRRFVVELGYLGNPAFLKLLEEAEEEYGFQHKGALTVPCSPEALQQILQYRRENV